MKHYHCIHCGVPVKGSAAAFCPKCKKPLRKPSKNRHPVPTKPKQPPQIKKTQRKKKKSWLDIIRLKPLKDKKPDVENTPVKNPMDEDYDGYYDDKPTEDNRQDKESLEPELIKRIAIISCGAVVLIILAIILMNLL